MKEFFFPNLSMLVTFFVAFTWMIVNQPLLPSSLRVKLTATCTSPEVDATLYRQLVGSLLYLTHTHPDLSFDVGLVAPYMQTPHESHWKEAKRILRNVRGTVQFGIHYSSGGTPLLVGLTDSDWAGDPDDRKSIAGYVFILGSDLSLAPVRNNRLLHFLQQKQSTE
jgi:hypothetical protein